MKIQFENDYVIETTYDFSPMRKNTFQKVGKELMEGRELANLEKLKRQEMGIPFYEPIKLTKSEKTVTVTREYKKLFPKGSSFESIQGVNILVGDNGCGKSTLIRKLIKTLPSSLQVLMVDLEKANPKISRPNPEKGLTYSLDEVHNLFMWAAESHGETREGVLLSVLSLEFDVLVLDEPEQGLSLRNQKKYINKLIDLNKDIIIITHSKVFIEAVESVFDVETMSWIRTDNYLKTI